MGPEREMREGGCQVVRAGREATEHSRGLISPGKGVQKSESPPPSPNFSPLTHTLVGQRTGLSAARPMCQNLVGRRS